MHLCSCAELEQLCNSLGAWLKFRAWCVRSLCQYPAAGHALELDHFVFPKFFGLNGLYAVHVANASWYLQVVGGQLKLAFGMQALHGTLHARQFRVW